MRAELQSDKTKQVLFETYDGKYAYGHTDNFLEVAVMSDCDLKSKILRVSLESTDGNLCFGSIITTDLKEEK